MEAPTQEEVANSEKQNDEVPKENETAEKEIHSDELKEDAAPEPIKIPETNEEPEKRDLSENVEKDDAPTEPAPEETEIQEEPEPVVENSSTEDKAIPDTSGTSNEVIDSVVIEEVTDSAISEEKVEEPVADTTSVTVIEEATEIDPENISQSSDANITLPLIEEEENEVAAVEKEDHAAEVVSAEIPEIVVSESSQIDNVTEEESLSMVEEPPVEQTVPLVEEPVELLTQPPILAEATAVEEEETTLINGMPILDKEVVSEADLENHKIDENNLTELVVVSMPSSLHEPETIEVIREEAIVPSLPEGDVKEETVKDEQAREVVIPRHILGRHIDRPMSEDECVRNGKVRKPRLGVKIPNRNLTSQIVSGKEIQEEVMERSRLRNATADDPSGGDLFFAKKLTQRLAKKLTEKSIKTSPTTSTAANVEVKPFLDTSSKITDNSDLIALLEGDDDIDWTPTDSSKKMIEKKTPEWERETALKQLRELPKQGKISRSSGSKSSTSSSPSKSSENLKEPTEEPTVPMDDNSEPRFSMGVVTKTYTRKRKSSNDIKLLTASILQSQKKLHAEKEKDKDKPSSATSSPDTPQSKQSEKTPQKLVENTKASPSKSQKSRSSSDKKEMPTLKKESPIEKHTPTPKVQKPIEEKKNPQVSLEKPQSQPAVVKAVTPTVTKTPDSSVRPQLSPNTYISKSSRIVKKKKIWDPDEDTIPKYLKPVVKSPKVTEPVEKAAEKKVEKVSEKKSEKVSEKKVEKVSEKKSEKVSEKVLDKKVEKKPVEDSPAQADKPSVLKPSNERAKPRRPTLKKVIMKKKPKRLTEIDRLLMDEGAVNLLYAVKNTEELLNVTKKKGSKSVISIDRAQRELLNKTNEIKNDLQINSTKDSPISLRKKEGAIKLSPNKEMAAPVLLRKKSTGSAHSPPASPAFYNQHAEASRIIRRHSSSSFSSENAETEESGERQSSKKSSEPQKKKMRTHSDRHSSSMGVDKQLLSEEMAKNFNNVTPNEPKYTQYETFNVRTHEKFVQIILSPSGPFGKTTLSVKALTELAAVLKILKNDDECHSVLLSSSGAGFCQGIDYKELVLENQQQRVSLCEKYAKCIKDFLITLSNFPKVIIAGVHGHTVGLGVTMLPLFDMVLASDTATFSTPYTTLGCAAEGGILVTLPHVVHSALASELFFASRKLTAGEAFRLGLVTRTLWPDKFQEELITASKITSGQSLQSMQAIKDQLRRHLRANIEKSLEAESSVLVQHWTSIECQSKFLDYNIERKPFLT